MQKALSICLISAALLVSSTALAERDQDGPKTTERTIREGAEEAEKAIREGAEKIMRSLEMMFRSIPQYEAPEINEKGDIIIRRKRTPPPKKKPPIEDEDTAST